MQFSLGWNSLMEFGRRSNLGCLSNPVPEFRLWREIAPKLDIGTGFLSEKCKTQLLGAYV